MHDSQRDIFRQGLIQCQNNIQDAVEIMNCFIAAGTPSPQEADKIVSLINTAHVNIEVVKQVIKSFHDKRYEK